jgi:hypothetical protein
MVCSLQLVVLGALYKTGRDCFTTNMQAEALAMGVATGLLMGHVLTRLSWQQGDKAAVTAAESLKQWEQQLNTSCRELQENAWEVVKSFVRSETKYTPEHALTHAVRVWDLGRLTLSIVGTMPFISACEGIDNMAKLHSYINTHMSSVEVYPIIVNMLGAEKTREPADVPLTQSHTPVDTHSFIRRVQSFIRSVYDPQQDTVHVLQMGALLVQSVLECLLDLFTSTRNVKTEKALFSTLTHRDQARSHVPAKREDSLDRQLWSAWTHYSPVSLRIQ